MVGDPGWVYLWAAAVPYTADGNHDMVRQEAASTIGSATSAAVLPLREQLP